MFKLLMVLLIAASLPAADLSGRWIGTFTPDGDSQGPALLILQQTGDSLTGSAGPNEKDRHDISNGKVSGDKVTFEVVAEAIMKFELTLKGEELSGQVTRENQGRRQTAQLKVTREK